MKVRTASRIFSSIVITVCALFLMQMYDVVHYGNSKADIKVDAAIVLGAAAWGKILHRFFAKESIMRLICINPVYVIILLLQAERGFERTGESVIGREYAVKNGVPESDIFIENYSKSTEENIRYAQQVAAKHSLTSFFLVSDSYHLRRAAFIANHYGLIVYPSPTPTSVYRSSENRCSFFYERRIL